VFLISFTGINLTIMDVSVNKQYKAIVLFMTYLKHKLFYFVQNILGYGEFKKKIFQRTCDLTNLPIQGYKCTLIQPIFLFSTYSITLT